MIWLKRPRLRGLFIGEEIMSYGLLGEKLGHSFSKILHAAIGNDDYELIEVAKDKVDDYLAASDFDGINVTIPYKEVAMRYCEPDETATEIGCVNTLLKKDGKVYGYNTDCLGFAYLAESIGAKWCDSKVVILGSGGTSKTATYVAVKGKASEVVIVSRKAMNVNRDEALCIRHSTYEHSEEWKDADILINTTPVGMYPNNDGMPVDLDVFDSLKAVVDVIYNPLETRLVQEAKKRGIPAGCGLPMLVAQGYFAEKIWGKVEIKDCDQNEMIESITADILRMKQNIVLTGMPGSGKSTIGRLLADKLKRDFVDTDEEFSERFGITPGECITTYGEEKFRDMESEVVLRVSKESGRVIATGGGAILRQENRDALKSNGYVIFLNRDPGVLATDGRPLSQKDGVMKLYEERMPIYRAFKDIEVNVSDDPNETLDQALTEFSK